MYQTSSSGHCDQVAVSADCCISNRPVGCEVGLRDLDVLPYITLRRDGGEIGLIGTTIDMQTVVRLVEREAGIIGRVLTSYG